MTDATRRELRELLAKAKEPRLDNNVSILAITELEHAAVNALPSLLDALDAADEYIEEREALLDRVRMFG